MMNVMVLIVAIIFLAISSYLSVVDPNAGATLLSFFCTVIVSWLISNMANEKEAKKKQEDLAKVSHRHLGDVEKSALSIEQSIKDFTDDFINKPNPPSYDAIFLFLKSLDSRMDDLKDRITSTNRDWYDLLADEVKNEIKNAEDPEADTISGGSMTPDLSLVTRLREATEAAEAKATEVAAAAAVLNKATDEIKEEADV